MTNIEHNHDKAAAEPSSQVVAEYYNNNYNNIYAGTGRVMRPEECEAIKEAYNDNIGAMTGAEPEHASTSGLDDAELSGHIRPVRISYHDVQAIQAQGPVVIARDLVDGSSPTWHDPQALRDAFSGVLKLCRSRQR